MLGKPKRDNTEGIKILLDAKADLFAMDMNTDIPLCLLAKTADNVYIANMLIQRMIEIDSKKTVSSISTRYQGLPNFSLFICLSCHLNFLGRSHIFVDRSCLHLKKDILESRCECQL